MQLNRDVSLLYQKLGPAIQDRDSVSNPEEFLVMGNYVGNLYRSLVFMGDASVDITHTHVFGSEENYQKFLKHLNAYNNQLLDSYLLKQGFHRQFCGEALPDVEDGLWELLSGTKSANPEEDHFTPKEFDEVFFGFLKSIGLLELFEKYLKERRIHSNIIGQDAGNLGFMLHNPMKRDTDIFVKDFHPTFYHMATLAHEFGHVYDLENFHGDAKKYNEYFYLSFFEEVMPRLLERLIHRYCLKNHIMVPVVISSYVDLAILCHDYFLQGYIFSLLDPALLRKGLDSIDLEEIVSQVKDHFKETAPLHDYVKNLKELSLPEVYSYLYGDILSMFFAEDVEANGMNSEMMEYFFSRRSEPFPEDFMRECGFGPKNYTKLYQKEVKLIKN